MLAVAVFLVAAQAGGAAAQGPRGPRAPTSSSVKLDEAENAARAHLERVQQYIANAQWDEAAEVLHGLMDSDGGRLVALPTEAALRGDEFVRFVPLRDFCQWRLASSAKDAPQLLEAYRKRVDPLAEAWLRTAIAERDPQRLQEIAARFFVSRSGDDALLRLGELDLERGYFARARSAWQQLSPLLSDDQPRDARLIYPDTDLDVGSLAARLALVSILERSSVQSQRELDLLGRIAPEATGTLGGRSGRCLELLRDLLAASQMWPPLVPAPDWTTFAGSGSRSQTAAADVDIALRPLWSVPLPRRPASDHAALTPDSTSGWPCYHPVVLGSSVFIQTGDTLDDVHAYELRTGRRLWLDTELPPEAVAARATDLRGAASGELPQTRQYTVTIQGDRLYVGLGPAAPVDRGGAALGTYVAALDWKADKRRLFEIHTDEPPWTDGWTVDGVPVADDGLLYVGLRQRDGVLIRAHVAAFDVKRGEMTWRRFVAGAEAFDPTAASSATANLLSLDEGILYYNTNLGAIAALRARDGQVRWVTRYPQIHATDGDVGSGHALPRRGLTPCLVHRGTVFAAPSDCDHVFALDAATGLLRWATPAGMAGDVQFLLGVGEDHLIASGRRLTWIAADSGQIRARFPARVDESLRGFGRGVLAGKHVYWPTRDRIYVFDQQGPQQARQAIELAPMGLVGGNLAIAHDVLLLAGPDRLSAFDACGPLPVSP